MATYEPIMNALLAYLQANIAANVFLTYRRGLVLWPALSQPLPTSGSLPLRQPALFLFDGLGFGGGRTRYEPRGRALPMVRVLERSVVIYAQAATAGAFPGGSGPGPDNLPTGGGTILHPLIEAVEAALALPDRDGALTLGGLVSHVWLKGGGMLSSPDIDPNGQGMASLPIEIMIP